MTISFLFICVYLCGSISTSICHLLSLSILFWRVSASVKFQKPFFFLLHVIRVGQRFWRHESWNSDEISFELVGQEWHLRTDDIFVFSYFCHIVNLNEQSFILLDQMTDNTLDLLLIKRLLLYLCQVNVALNFFHIIFIEEVFLSLHFCLWKVYL